MCSRKQNTIGLWNGLKAVSSEDISLIAIVSENLNEKYYSMENIKVIVDVFWMVI